MLSAEIYLFSLSVFACFIPFLSMNMWGGPRLVVALMASVHFQQHIRITLMIRASTPTYQTRKFIHEVSISLDNISF